MPTFRIEATVPAIRYVEAKTPKAALRRATTNDGSGRDEWEIDLDAPIEEDHVVAVISDDSEATPVAWSAVPCHDGVQLLKDGQPFVKIMRDGSSLAEIRAFAQRLAEILPYYLPMGSVP